MSLTARIAALLIVLTAIAGAWWKFDRMLAAADARGYERRADEDRKVIEAQESANRDLQRAAEKRYVVTREGQDHYFTKTIKEIVHDAAPMAACPVPEPVRVRLNAAAACASGDSPASCFAADEVSKP